MPAATKPQTARQIAASRIKDGQPGAAPWGKPDEAAAYEDAIASEAIRIRGDDYNGDLTPALFLKLWPLLKRPLHPGHVVHTTRGKGKPYASDGARSVQVLVDRMNNVLTPLNWEVREEYHSDGQLCEVTVTVVDLTGDQLVSRSSWGGVNQATVKGNLYKGSFTNAAKVAFARLGPGHEIYLGALDYDPDTNSEVAALQDRKPKERASRAKDDTGSVTEPTPEERLTALLAEAGPLQAKRQEADKGMQLADTPVDQRLEYLLGRRDEAGLDALIQDVNDYLNTKTNGS